jgi:predicted dehydrogenase
VNDPDVDVVYVATPHPFHREHSILFLKAGKAVLCEKPLAINAQEVEEIIRCARETKKFLMEAMWTRFIPVMAKVREWLAEGAIGEARMLTADFGFRSGWDPEGRLLNPKLAGGALLDVGVYTVAMASMVFGRQPSRIASMAHIGETGIDEQSAMLLGYDAGQLAILSCAVRTNTPQEARIIGTEGAIHIPDFWHATSATLNVSGKDTAQIEIPFDGNGYNYEAAEVMCCLRAGKLESDIMPLDESLDIMATMDKIRAQCGLRYPME